MKTPRYRRINCVHSSFFHFILLTASKTFVTYYILSQLNIIKNKNNTEQEIHKKDELYILQIQTIQKGL